MRCFVLRFSVLVPRLLMILTEQYILPKPVIVLEDVPGPLRYPRWEIWEPPSMCPGEAWE